MVETKIFFNGDGLEECQEDTSTRIETQQWEELWKKEIFDRQWEKLQSFNRKMLKTEKQVRTLLCANKIDNDLE